MTRLTLAARDELRWCDVTAAGWARWNGWPDGVWRGDECGCPDDRCIGYHHDGDDCGCLVALLMIRADELRVASNAGATTADLRAGRFGGRYPLISGRG